MSEEKQQMQRPALKPEREFDGPIWKHPYLAYALIVLILFLGLVIAAWLAIKNGWLPNSGS